MKITHVLSQKNRGLLSIAPDQLLVEAVDKMMEHRVGSLVVMEHGRLVSIITERDVMWAVNTHNDSINEVKISELMAKQLVTCSADDTVDHAMDMMINNPLGYRIRHLPVVANGDCVGVISIGDIVQALLTETQFENNLLKNYIKNWPESEE